MYHIIIIFNIIIIFLYVLAWIHIDIIPVTEMCIGGIQYHLLCCDDFSTHLQSFPVKTKSNTDIIYVFTTMIAIFKQLWLYRTSHTVGP